MLLAEWVSAPIRHWTWAIITSHSSTLLNEQVQRPIPTDDRQRFNEEFWYKADLIYTPQELARLTDRPFLKRALSEGRVIYESEQESISC